MTVAITDPPPADVADELTRLRGRLDQVVPAKQPKNLLVRASQEPLAADSHLVLASSGTSAPLLVNVPSATTPQSLVGDPSGGRSTHSPPLLGGNIGMCCPTGNPQTCPPCPEGKSRPILRCR
jgi:hypothetical protein